MADNPNTLPADFFSTKSSSNPDTLPADFFAGRGGGGSGTPSRGGRNAGGGQGNEGAAKLKGNLTTDILGGAAEVVGNAVRGTVRTTGHVAQAMTGNVGPAAQDVGNAVQAQSDQWDKAKSAWNRGQQPGNPNSFADKVEAGGHALAAALPLVGPGAAEAGETIGGEVAYDDPAHPAQATSLVRAPQVGRGIGQGLGTVLLSSPKNITGPILSKTGGALATAADRMGVPEALERSAGVSYRKMLTPTAKGVVTEAEQIAGGPSPKGPTGLVKDRPMALTRKGMMGQAQTKMDEVGPRTATVYNDKPPLDPQPILDHLEGIRKQKAIVKGTGVVSDPALNNAIDEIKQNIEDMRGEDGKIAAATLDDLKDKLNRGNVSPKGHMRALPPQSAASIEKSVADRIGGYLDTAYPDAAEVNAAYRTAKHTHGFLEEQRQAEIAAQSGVRTGSSSGFGAAIKKAVPAPLRGIPNAISAGFDSVAWDSTMGATKAKIAELIRSGSWDRAAEAMRPLPKLLTQGDQVPPPPPDTSSVRGVPAMASPPFQRKAIASGRGTIFTPPPADTSGVSVTTGEPLRAPVSRQLEQGPSVRVPSDLSGQAGDITDLVPIKNPLTGQIEYIPRPSSIARPFVLPRSDGGGVGSRIGGGMTAPQPYRNPGDQQ